MNVMVVDSEQAFTSNLISRLSRLLPEVQASGHTSDLDCLASLKHSAVRECLIIYNQDEFPKMPAQIAQLDLAVTFEFWTIMQVAENSPVEAKHIFYRFGSVKELAGRIKSKTTATGQNNQLDTRKKAEINPGSICERDRAPLMNLLLTVYPSGYQPEISRQRLGELVNSGRQIIYLPLMPTYQMACVANPGRGPSLSDLLLQLLGQNIHPSQLSQYWQPHPAGYLQFRPPDRSDDLVLCSPDILRRLAGMLRDKLTQEPDPCTALIDCAGMPLASVAAVAVLCDHCEIGFPEDDTYASESAKIEIGQLLAILPASCKIQEIRHPAWLRPAK